MAFNTDRNRQPNRPGGDRGGFRPRFNDRGPAQMYSAVCASCSKNCQVPFRPSSGKPVYCSDCFEQRGGNDSRGFENRPRRPEPRVDTRFEEINTKLDKILSLLTIAAEDLLTETPIEIEEPPKKVVIKKSTKKKSPAG